MHKNVDTKIPTIKGKVVSVQSLGSYSEVLLVNDEIEVSANIENDQKIEIGSQIILTFDKK